MPLHILLVFCGRDGETARGLALQVLRIDPQPHRGDNHSALALPSGPRWNVKKHTSSRASRMEEAGRKIGRTLGEAERRIQDDLQQVIDYLDKEVVVTVRNESSRGLRIAAEKLSKLADFMDQQRKR